MRETIALLLRSMKWTKSSEKTTNPTIKRRPRCFVVLRFCGFAAKKPKQKHFSGVCTPQWVSPVGA
jgi:hypothetical protein